MLPGWGFRASVFQSLADLLADDLRILLPRADESPQDSLQRAVGDGPLPVLGWSLGGMQAMQLALAAPASITQLLLIATTPRFVATADWAAGMPQTVFDGFCGQQVEDDAAAMQQFVRLNAGRRPQRATSSCLHRAIDPAMTRERQAGLQLLQQMDLRQRLAEVRQPTLLLHAADDRIVPLAAGRWLAGHMPNSRLVEFTSGGHAFFIEQAQAVADAIRSWPDA
jgi:pimeloyl-[acyl-carrier protein] methyl ester esterase